MYIYYRFDNMTQIPVRNNNCHETVYNLQNSTIMDYFAADAKKKLILFKYVKYYEFYYTDISVKKHCKCKLFAEVDIFCLILFAKYKMFCLV